MNLEQVIGQKKYYLIWLIIFICGTVFLFIGLTSNSIWYDEAFTGALARHSFMDIIRISAGDNHPPLYFIITKIITFILGDNAFSLRTASLLGVLALAALGLGPVKRIFGSKASLLFTFLVFITPAFVAQAQNARMYTWAAFFTTACVLYAYLVVTENKLRDWILFGIVSVLGLYTHVYLMLEFAIIYALVFLWLILKDRKKLITFLIVAASVVILYTPWIFVVIVQASKVAKEFWIPEPTSPWILWGMLFVPFQHEFGSTMSNLFINIACFICSGLTVLGIINAVKNQKTFGNLIFLCIAVAVLTFSGAFIISYIVRPILMPRYFISVIGLYIIVLMYGILLLKQDALKIIAAVLVLALFIPQLIDIKTVKRNGPLVEVQEYLNDELHPDDVFLHGEEQPFGLFSYYYPEYRHYLLLPEDFSGFGNYDAFGQNGSYGNDYSDFLKGASRVWLVNRDGSSWFRITRIANEDLLQSAEIYKASLTKRFSQNHSFLMLSITKFSTDPKDKLDESAMFEGEIKELKIKVSGFKNNKGNAIIYIFNRELFELSDYFSQNKLPPQIEQAVFDKLIMNNNFLTGEDKNYWLDVYALDENSGIYNLIKQSEEIDREFLKPVYKLHHSISKTL